LCRDLRSHPFELRGLDRRQRAVGRVHRHRRRLQQRRLNNYEPELFVKLTPEKFASTEERADFYEKWRDDVLQNSTKAKIAASKTCVKDQCDEITKRIDKETELALAAIESNRNQRSSPTSPAASPSPLPVQTQP